MTDTRLARLRVKDWQSLRAADLHFGSLSVLVGPSNSGKTAVLRALRALACNVPSPSVVTVGEKVAAIRADFRDGATVALQRGAGVSTYILRPAGSPEPLQLPKSGTSTPIEVERELRFPSADGDPIWWAGQHDAPFLLSLPPAQVARVVGSLTGVHVLAAASREANKRRLRAVAEVRVFTGIIERLEGKRADYLHLKETKTALSLANKEFEQAKGTAADVQQLRDLLHVWQLATERHQEAAAVQINVPSLVPTRKLIRAQSQLSKAVAAYQRAVDLSEAANDQAVRAATKAERLAGQLSEALTAAGVCPVCGQAVS